MTAVAFSIQQAVRAIASRCDGALEQDGVGFNGRDAHFGKSLAAIPHDDWSIRMLQTAHSMLRTYRTQLAGMGIEYDALLGPEPEFRARVAAREARRAPKPEVALGPRRIFRDEQRNRWLLEFPYDRAIIDGLKALGVGAFLANRPSEPTRYLWPVYEDKLLSVIPLLAGFEGAEDVAAGVLEREALKESNRKASGALVARTDVSITSVSGKRSRAYQDAGVEYVLRAKRVLNGDQPGVGKTLQAISVIVHSKAIPALVVPPASLKLNWHKELAEWAPHLRAEIIETKKDAPSGNADIYIANYDILKSETVYMVKGLDRPITKAELEELNEERAKRGSGILEPRGIEILTSVAKRLKALGLKSIVFDEFHFCKHKKSQRSKAAKLLAKDVEYRLGLTGTPVEIRPIELASQLDILGRLDTDFGGYMRFAKTYCQARETAYGLDVKGHSNLDKLHLRLRECCYVRRLKEEVLSELPPKVYARIPIRLSNRAEYDSAEENYLEWVLENEGREKALRASRAEEITRIGGLQQIAARGKVDGIKEWVEGFLEAGEKLVLFAHHIAVQHALLAGFPGAVAIQGGAAKEAVEEAKARFFGSADLIVCSIKAGGLGHTLHADGRCSNVAMSEFPWSPAQQEQCEDRVHRIGQTSESVNVWELYAPGTIDDDTLAMLDERRKVVDAVTDGGERERAKVDGVEGALVERMKLKAREMRARKAKPCT